MPESTNNQPKPKGGKRPGAGRKPTRLKTLVKKLPDFSAKLILAEINAQQKLIALANSKDESIQLATIKFVWEHAYGKPKQPISNDSAEGFKIVVEHIGGAS